MPSGSAADSAGIAGEVLLYGLVYQWDVDQGVGGGVSFGSGASVLCRTCIAMPSIGVVASSGTADNDPDSSSACRTAFLAMLSAVTLESAGIGTNASLHR